MDSSTLLNALSSSNGNNSTNNRSISHQIGPIRRRRRAAQRDGDVVRSHFHLGVSRPSHRDGVRCRHCNLEMAENLSRMREHIQERCENYQYIPGVHENTGSGPITRTQWDSRCLSFIYRAGLPLNWYESHHQRDFFRFIAQDLLKLANWRPLSRNRVTSSIDQFYDIDKGLLKQWVRCQEYLNFSFDESTDNSNRRIFNTSVFIPGLGPFFLKNIDIGKDR
jgi:hypothetical protein